eukprot:750176-Hanusia_phi.AAC.1
MEETETPGGGSNEPQVESNRTTTDASDQLHTLGRESTATEATTTMVASSASSSSASINKTILEKLKTADAQIVQILREIKDSGQAVDEKLWKRLKKKGVKAAHMKEAGLANEYGVLIDPNTSAKTEDAGKNFRSEDGTPLLKDSLGRFPAWTRQGVHSVQRIDTNPLSLVTIPTGTLMGTEQGQGKITVYNPMYGMPNISFDVVVPEHVIQQHRNVTKVLLFP